MATSNASSGLVNKSLLDKIDRLFACNAGDHVDLPQIVVVGDQSSGKSSVLEGLTRLPFPRDSELCTRFATQITFRRSVEASIKVSIIPSKTCSDEHRQQVSAWAKTDIEELTSSIFAEIMKEVMEVMGIDSKNTTGQRTFSEDVLRLEISGPTQEHFSVIDVPGIFKRTTAGVTTKEDIELVNNIVRSYMSNPRSVMLTVVPCNVDIATQEILERAEDLDPEGIRTLGVLTKPDLVDKGAEPSVLALLEEKKQQLKLGWHLLRNPGQSELLGKSGSRVALEKDFFSQKAPWNTVAKDKVGIDALRVRLQDILGEHIRREFPKVKQELTKRLKDAKGELAKLGPKRQTESEQREFVVKIALSFQQMVDNALQASYRGSTLSTRGRKPCLASETVNRAQAFERDMRQKGNCFQFASKEDETKFEGVECPNDIWAALGKAEMPNLAFPVRLVQDILEIQDVLHQNVNLPPPYAFNILVWLKREYEVTRGFELGTFDPVLLRIVMREQAAKWRDVSLGYISDITVLVHSFITTSLKEITPSRHVESLVSLLMDGLLSRYRKATEHTNFLLDVELEGTPATLNHYFNEQLQKCRADRIKGRLASKVIDLTDSGKAVRLDDIATSNALDNPSHTVLEIHDILHAYYKVALKRVIDCLRMQVADHFLVTGPDTPLSLFSAAFVTALTPEQLEEVAGEDSGLKRRRALLEKEIAQLEVGKSIIS